MKWSDIEEIKNANPDLDEIFIMLGVRKEDVGKEDDDDQFLTTILVGLKNNTLLTNKLIDFCDPCPNNCPKNFDQEIATP